MTTIIAVQKKGYVILGSDSQVTYGSSKSSIKEGKIRSNGKYTFGISGLAAFIDEVQHADLPVPESGQDLRRFVYTELAPAFKKIEEGLLTKFDVPKEHWDHYSSSALVVIHGTVFHISGGIANSPSGSGVYAIGSGTDYAVGSLGNVKNPRERDVRNALLAASKNDVGSAGPFIVKKVV